MKKHLSHKLASVMTVGLMAGASTQAFAAGADLNNLNSLTNNITGSAGSLLPSLLSAFGFLAGSSFSVLGIMHLKAHVDNPGQKDLKGGLMRLAAGGALLSLPLITSAMQGAINNGNGVNQAAVLKLNTFS